MRKFSALALVLMLASFGSVAMGQAQPGDPAAPRATTDVERVDNRTDFGWLGLLGLIGLMGLKRREPNTVRTTTPATAAR